MRIEGLKSEATSNAGRRISARLVLEEGAAEHTLYFEADPPTGELLEPSPETFLTAAYSLAAWHGERRVRVESSVSPLVRDGLRALGSFFGVRLQRSIDPTIEPTGGFQARIRPDGAGTWCFMSGGADSLALLRANRVDYSLDHPWSVTDAVFLVGLNSFDWLSESVGDPKRLPAYRRLERVLRPFLEANGCRLHVVRTNIRSLYPSFRAWGRVGFVTGATCVAHAFPSRLARALFASGGTGVPSRAAVSHSSQAYLLSSEATQLHTAQLVDTRLEKLSMIVDWPGVLSILKVCFWRDIPSDGLNCGRCEKCIRTMLGLVALGRLQEATCFPRRDLTPDDLGRLRWVEALYAPEMVEPLRAQGRSDLADVLERRLLWLRRRQRLRRSLGMNRH